MRLVVFGAGAVGGVIAGRVFEHGNEVVAIARGAHFEAMRDRGMRLVDPDRKVTLSIPVVDHPARIEAALSAPELDFDRAHGLVRDVFAGTSAGARPSSP